MTISNMPQTRQTGRVGVVLAGGLSRRMFERATVASDWPRDKGLLALGRLSMIETVMAAIGPTVDCLIINANGDASRFAALNVPVVADTVEGFVGPLAGVLAGMRWTAEMMPDASHILTVAADAPFLPDDLGDRFAHALQGRAGSIAIARSGGELHPVIGFWPVALADDLELALQAGVRKVLAWTDRHGTVPVDFAMIELAGLMIDPFFNANTPADLDEARRFLALLQNRNA